MRKGSVVLVLTVIFLTLTFIEATSAVTPTKASVYINNTDDDDLWVELSIDGIHRRGEYVSSDGKKYYGLYYLDPGIHTLGIKWRDPDLCGEWQEKTKNITVGSEFSTEIILSTVRNDEQKECILETPCKLEVYIRNEDDDNLWIDLFVDKYLKIKEVRSGSRKYYGEYILDPGVHTLKLRWLDPDDVFTMREKVSTVTLHKGEHVVVTLYTYKYLLQ